MSKSPPRPSMSAARRVRLFMANDGICHLCSQKIKVTETYELDHLIPWALGFDDSDSNLKPAHTECHRGAGAKTADDVKRIAKAKRQGLEQGQQARRSKNGPTMKSRPFANQPKKPWPSRPFPRREK